MAGAICFSATFLTGRYHGEEWPPSPARFLQALVAGVKTGGYRAHWARVESGLRWLEKRPAPSILARPVVPASAYRIAVPNNDFDSVAREWVAGRAADPAKLRTMKDVFPRMVEGDPPHVRYIWNLQAGEDAVGVAGLMGPLAECLYCLGWGVDMAFSRMESDEPCADGYEEWLPSVGGNQLTALKVPAPGFLDDLEATYQAFTRRTQTMNTDTRPTVYRLQRYRRRGPASSPYALFGLRAADGIRPLSKPWQTSMEVAAWMRHAAGKALQRAAGIDVDSFVLGHTEGERDRSNRISFVPLPSIGHPNADGRIRRIMIAEPRAAEGRVAELLEMKLAGARLTNLEGANVCTLASDEGSAVTPFYIREATLWRSVTPVVLHGYNVSRGRIDMKKTENLLRRAFAMAGYAAEEIEGLAFQQAPLWNGAGGAAQMRVPAHLDRYPRYHIEVRFRARVAGPVLAGIGRHYGIGVFAAPSV